MTQTPVDPTVSVGPEPVLQDGYDSSVHPEDGPQDVDQDPGYELAESDTDEEDDPEVHEVA
jgi:hypothetical protein